MRTEIRSSSKPFQGLDEKISIIRGYYEAAAGRGEVRAFAEEAGMGNDGKPSLEALFSYLRGVLRYVPDPVDHELIKAPWIMVDDIRRQGWTAGDCDDFASLSFTLLRLLGIRARLAVGWYGSNENPTHIWTVVPTKMRDVWLNFDLVGRQLGETKPGASAVLTYE